MFDRILSVIDGPLVGVMVIALVPNLLIILMAVARLSQEVRILKSKVALLEQDVDLLDQSLSSLSTEFQNFRSGAGKRPGITPPPIDVS
jgi:hypothetical protein